MRSQRRPKAGVHPERQDRGRLPLTLRDAGAPRADDGAATPLLLVQRDSADRDELPARNPWRSISATPAAAGACFCDSSSATMRGAVLVRLREAVPGHTRRRCRGSR